MSSPAEPLRPEQFKFLVLVTPVLDHCLAELRPLLTLGEERVARARALDALTRRALRDDDGALDATKVTEYVEAFVLVTTDPRRRQFLQTAATALVDRSHKRLQFLPSAVADCAYDSTCDAVMRRAQQGVSGFCGPDGQLLPDKVLSFVKFVLDKKVNDGWNLLRGRRETGLDEGRTPDSRTAPDADDDARRLDDDRRRDSLLEQARAELERIQMHYHDVDALRLRLVEQALTARGIDPRRAAIVRLRATRAWECVVGDDGVRRRYLPPTSEREIAEQIGVSYANVRQLYARAMSRLEDIRSLVEKPESFEGLDGDDGADHA